MTYTTTLKTGKDGKTLLEDIISSRFMRFQDKNLSVGTKVMIDDTRTGVVTKDFGDGFYEISSTFCNMNGGSRGTYVIKVLCTQEILHLTY